MVKEITQVSIKVTEDKGFSQADSSLKMGYLDYT